MREAKDALHALIVELKKVLIPIMSAADMGTVPPELMGKFNMIFYQSPEDAIFKALGAD